VKELFEQTSLTRKDIANGLGLDYTFVNNAFYRTKEKQLKADLLIEAQQHKFLENQLASLDNFLQQGENRFLTMKGI
jgi:hypothetical protein